MFFGMIYSCLDSDRLYHKEKLDPCMGLTASRLAKILMCIIFLKFNIIAFNGQFGF